MFRSNQGHRQQNSFDGHQWLVDSLRQQLEDSWAGTFYHLWSVSEPLWFRAPKPPVLQDVADALR